METNKLTELISKCKCGVYLEVNTHKDFYQSIETYFKSDPFLIEDKDDIDAEVFQKMIDTNTVIRIQFYPDTPIGSYTVYHYDLGLALTIALSIITR